MHRAHLTRILALSLALFAHATGAETWWPANDGGKVTRRGSWEWTSHRYAADSALVTFEDGAALEVDWEGTTLVLGLDLPTPPNYHTLPELGALDVFLDGKLARTVQPQAEDREVVLLRTAAPERHRVRLVHRSEGGRAGVRIRGFGVSDKESGDLAFVISGEQNNALVDVRATLTREGRVVRDGLVRNWLTAQCRLAALPPGDDYVLELQASGWQSVRLERIAVRAGEETRHTPIFLRRAGEISADEFKFPGPGRPVVVRPGESFRARFEADKAEIRAVRIVRQQGPATISRVCAFAEDKVAGFYYHREGTMALPADTPPGLYDLEVTIAERGGTHALRSRQCVQVVKEFPTEPVFVGFGHFDTWGQYHAEYLARVLAVANVIGPDLVLISNEANPAYVAGALQTAEVPCVINFGNHRWPEAAPWFGEPIGVVDFGRVLSVLNFGRAWDSGSADVDALLAARASTRIKVINAFESNAPVGELLDKHGVSLVHYAHGPGPAIATMGATPTVRVGKVNAESFRVIRFKDGRPATYTYRGHATGPVPFPRVGPPPIRVSYAPANDGQHRAVTATFENDLEEAFPRARAVFVLPRGTYRTSAGGIESAVESDDGRFTVVTVRFDLPAIGRGTVEVSAQ
ncbi:MAG TPA: hypothetical protein VM029_08470 [Opitutaceae bacterium]|nr:hypothetical protein [Opitutaceae bacterium]